MAATGEKEGSFVFSCENFRRPSLPKDLKVIHVPLTLATDDSLKGFGRLVRSLDEFSCAKKNFEITPWPTLGWRTLDPGTGDEAGTTEGPFEVTWDRERFIGRNLAISTENNVYLDGLGVHPDVLLRREEEGEEEREGEGGERREGEGGEGENIYLWMSDYHPDGAQLFWPVNPIPFAVALGPSTCGDDVRPSDMRAFLIPAGCGVYFSPGTWHNGVYIRKRDSPATFITRQGRVHARVSASWAHEFASVLCVSLDFDSLLSSAQGTE